MVRLQQFNHIPTQADEEAVSSPSSSMIGSHARVSFHEVESAGPPVQPLEFPAPTVHRCYRIAANGCDHRTGDMRRLRSVLVKTATTATNAIDSRWSTSSSLSSSSTSTSTSSMSLSSKGYWMRRKLSDSVHGQVRLCVVVRRRVPFLRESTTIEWKRQSSLSSLSSISEDGYWKAFDPTGYANCHQEEDDDIWESTEELVVVKIISWAKVRHLRGRHLEDPVREVAAMQLLGDYHPYVIGSIETLQDDEYLYTIMPYCNDGDLYYQTSESLKRTGSGALEESQAREWFRQILMGLHHLQKKGVCHRDISLENIMVHDGKCILIDMGMSLRVPHSDPHNPGCVTDVSAGTVRRLMRAQGQGGKWAYMAPELVSREDQFDGFAVDLWAAGVILYILLVGLAPFKWAHETDERFVRFTEGRLKETLRYWEIPVSDGACDLLQAMFWKEPERRLTLAEVMEHPWVMNRDAVVVQRESAVEKKPASPKRVKPIWFRRRNIQTKAEA